VTTPPVDPIRTKIEGVPSSDIDLHTDENLLNSLEVSARLRETGPVVWLEKYGIYALPRFAEVFQALKDWDTFNSGEGVGFNEFFNSIRETSLQTHGERHDEIKHIESRPLAPDKLKELNPRLREYAEGLVKELAGRTKVDGVRDIAMKMAGWSDELCRGVLNDYVYPSLDTTIHSMSTGLKLFAENPDQWAKVRANRKLLKSAVLEIVRLSTPIRFFTRYVTKDVEIGGVTLPAGSWVLVMFASANRDEREFPNPDAFDVERNPAQMVGWGMGRHSCLGRALARMEINVLFDVLADHFERFEVGDYAYAINNIIRGLDHLELTLTPASTS
jgi:cytochrome P450